MKTRLGTTIALAIAITPQIEAADIRIRPFVGPEQVGITAQAKVGVEARGTTTSHSLTVGAGFTLTCEGSTTVINVQRETNDTRLSATELTLNTLAPASGEGRYSIAGFGNWPLNQPHLCQVDMRGRLRDAVATISGSGFGFRLIASVGGLDMTTTDVRQFTMMRESGTNGGGCYP